MKITILVWLCLFVCMRTSLQAQTFPGGTGNISDDGQVNDFTALVGGLSPAVLDSSFGVVTVCLDITHTYDSDLDIHLVAPDGTEINLASGLGGPGDNYTNTCFDQNAAQGIVNGSPPFSGTWKPQETLGNMNNGQTGNGIWKLRIVDTYPQDAGILNSWSVTFGPNPATPFSFLSSNLPIIILNTNGTAIPDEPKIPGTMGIIFNGPGMMNQVTDPFNDFFGDIGIEKRGAYSQSLPQKPYNIELRDTSGQELNASLLGMPPEHDWCLIANYNDKVFIRNVLAYDLFAGMGNYASRTRLCEVVLNGSYQGIYVLCESIKRDANRVDIAMLDSSMNTALDVTGGYVIKNDYWNSTNSWLLQHHPIDHPNVDVHLVYHYPKPDRITLSQKLYLQGFINNFENALYSPGFAHPLTGYRQYLDVPSFVDYLIVNELARNNDGFKKSSYFYKDRDGAFQASRLKAGPVWDFDWAWKNIPGCSIFEATDGSGWAHHINDCFTDVNSPGWYVRLLQDTNFQNDFRCRWDYFRTNLLDTAHLHAYIDSIAQVLDSAQMRHFEKWGNLGVNTGTPEVEPDPLTFDLHITQFKNWIDERIAWLDSNIPGNSNTCGWLGIADASRLPEPALYPNPADDFFFLNSLPVTSGQNLTIYDLQGKALTKTVSVKAGTKVNTSLLENGFYLVRITADNGVLTGNLKLTVLH